MRCAIICVCLCTLGRSGQGFFTIFVAEQVIDGSINNIANNFEITAKILMCNLELQSQITRRRINLAVGPIESLMQKHFGRITSIGKKMIRTLQNLMEPFENEIEIMNPEDEALAAILDNVQVFLFLKCLNIKLYSGDVGPQVYC